MISIMKKMAFAIAVALGMGSSLPVGLSGAKSVYDFTVTDIDGNAVSLSKYTGYVIIIVNVASKCGYTPQYAELEAFYRKYADKKLVVLGFPANNFLWQEPGDDADIKTFCSTKYDVTFPMFSKVSVKGKDKSPLYKYLTSAKENGVVDGGVTWNFQKFLIDRSGKVVSSFAPGTSVADSSVVAAVESLL